MHNRALLPPQRGRPQLCPLARVALPKTIISFSASCVAYYLSHTTPFRATATAVLRLINKRSKRPYARLALPCMHTKRFLRLVTTTTTATTATASVRLEPNPLLRAAPSRCKSSFALVRARGPSCTLVYLQWSHEQQVIEKYASGRQTCFSSRQFRY